MASASPKAKAEALTRSGVQMLPVANMFHNVPAIWLGTAKNSLVPGFSGKMSGQTCQTTSSSTMVPAPRAVGSIRCHRFLRSAAAVSATAAILTSVA